MAFVDTQVRPQGEQQVGKLDVRGVLLRAADLIEQRGLCKGMQQDELGRLCIAGAVLLASDCYIGSAHNEAGLLAVDRFLRHIGSDDCGPAPWNNAPERTQAEVVAALRAAA